MKLRLLDCMCGAGGCTAGYEAAGFEVVGVDHRPMPNYCGADFIESDVLEVLAKLIAGEDVGGWRLDDFAAIHASPPCQNSSELDLA